MRAVLSVKRPSVHLALVVACLLLPAAAHAQGLADATTAADVPHSSSAAADDGLAALVNPAGLAYVDALQLTGGYLGRFGTTPSDFIFGNAAIAPFDGLTLAAGTGVVLTPIGFRTPYFVNSASLAPALRP